MLRRPFAIVLVAVSLMVGLSFTTRLVHAQNLSARIDQTLTASASEYTARRTTLLAAGTALIAPLTQRAASAPSARERALATALLVRIERPADAGALDTWTPDRQLSRYHNPAPYYNRVIAVAFAHEPALAYEALFLQRWPGAPDGLLEVIAAGPDGFARTASWLSTFSIAADFLVKLDPTRAATEILRVLPGVDPEWKAAYVQALGHTRVSTPAVTAALRALYEARHNDEHLQRSAHVALLSVGEVGLLDAYFIGIPTGRRSASELVEALEATLEPALRARITHSHARVREGVASVAGIARTLTVNQKFALLAPLASDPDHAVRVVALTQLGNVGFWQSIPPTTRRTATLPGNLALAIDTAAHSNNDDERSAAVEAMQSLWLAHDPTDAEKGLVAWLAFRDRSASVREAAQRIVAPVFGSPTGEYLLRMHLDSHRFATDRAVLPLDQTAMNRATLSALTRSTVPLVAEMARDWLRTHP